MPINKVSRSEKLRALRGVNGASCLTETETAVKQKEEVLLPLITREDKQAEVTSLSDKFGRSKAAFLVDFKGMDVESVTKLRKSLRPDSAVEPF